MHLESEAIVCSVRGHGEHGTIVRMLTPSDGLMAAYVRGGRGRRMRPILIPGNTVSAQLRSRTDTHLPQAAIELVHSRAPILSEALPASAIEWATALVTAALPERQAYPRIYQAMTGLLDAVEAAPSASGWAASLARFELLLLAELGYGRELPALPHEGNWPEILDALERTGADLFSELLTGRLQSLHGSRARLVERLKRVAS